MSQEMEDWESDKMEFNEIVATLKDAWCRTYNVQKCPEENIYWDAVRYHLYAIVPIYAEGVL